MSMSPDKYLLLRPETPSPYSPFRNVAGEEYENPLFAGSAKREDIIPGTDLVRVDVISSFDQPFFTKRKVASEVLIGGRDFLYPLEYFIDSYGADYLLMEMGIRPWGRIAGSEQFAWSAFSVTVVDTPENREAAFSALQRFKGETISLEIPYLRILRLR